MLSEYDKIILDGAEFPRPVGFSPQREDVYAGEITTMTGKTLKDLVGWKYSDIDLSWSILPQEDVENLIKLSGEFYLDFDDAEGTQSEKVSRESTVSMRHRYTINGKYYWKDVSIKIKFLDVH